MAFSLRPKSKKQTDPLNPEPKPEKQPLIINYDKDGVRIGDDGYPMTKTRKLMHNLFNAIFIWGILMIILGGVLAVVSYGQGQQYSGFEMETYGGNMYNGNSVADMLRYIGLFNLLTAIIVSIIHVQGFRWMYDKANPPFTLFLLGLWAVMSIGFGTFFFGVLSIPEFTCFVNIFLIVAILVTMRNIKKERPTLKKAKVAKTVVKK